MYERNQLNKISMLNFRNFDNLSKNKNEGNDEFYLAELIIKKSKNNLKKEWIFK